MKLSTRQLRQFVPTFGKVMMGLALASALGSASIAPAFADDNDGHRDNGWHKGEQRAEHHKRDQRNERYYYRDRYAPYYYSAPVYVPPPVYYAPQPSLGISLFFPLDLRR